MSRLRFKLGTERSVASRPGRSRPDIVPPGPTGNDARTIETPADPRWVMACRVAEQMQGPILPHERRQQLLRTGKILGLSAFDVSLIVAIVQDQARRGHDPQACPAAAARQLAMIRTKNSEKNTSRKTTVVLMLVLLALEVVVIAVA